MTTGSFNSPQRRDPMEELRKSMEALQRHDPMEELRRSMEAFQRRDPTEELRRSVEAFQRRDPMEELRKSMEALQRHDPMEELRRSMEAFQRRDPTEELRRSVEAFQRRDPTEELRRSMEAFQHRDPLGELRKFMEVLQRHDPMEELRKSMEMLGLDRIVSDLFQAQWPLAYESPGNDLIINSDSTISVDSQTVSYVEIQGIVNQIADRALDQSVKHLDRAVARMVSEIRSLKNPALEKLMTWLIFPIIVGVVLAVVNPVADFYIKRVLTTDKSQVVTSVEKTEQPTAYRQVSSHILNVRSTPSSKSPLLGRLRFEQVVVVIEKNGRWSLVAWSDGENGVQSQGWVFSKYIRKFR